MMKNSHGTSSQDGWSQSRPKSAISSPFKYLHNVTSDHKSFARVCDVRELEGDQELEFFFSRKLVGRPRASYAAEEIRNLDSIRIGHIDSNAHSINDILSTVPHQTINITRSPTKWNSNLKKEKKQRVAKVVSSTARRVRYDHLEYDRHMPPPELIDGPIVYEQKQFQVKKDKRKKAVPLWYHPIMSG
uniref:Uncharacterized protein n=1 Tax=Leptocylindrus danicus TaxID=163516 RepID=A0A7S2LPK5_9STRA|mmetsp:Transcript_7543/g.11223  ORF Transcript_7543/g.11223 Transcript_7543/m.11223 type:complete len:188 (+) Transcript_7543:261-824(+)